ncbi:MAG TPA: hypothetical protein VGR90_05835, partial [Acidimicrobiales bacterium]|nr:hypothetical protein [Acidimicrobiales bacterium]
TPSGGAFAPGQPSAAGVILTDIGPGSNSGRGAGFDALAVLAAAALFVLWATTLRQAALHPLVAPARARRRAAVVRAAHAPPRRGPRQGYRAPTRPS